MFLKWVNMITYTTVNLFQANDLFLYLLKTAENHKVLIFPGGIEIEN